MAKASLLSAFWLQGNSGEINVFETTPASINNGLVSNNNFHCFDAVGTAASTTQSPFSLASFDPSAAFNTYGIDWTASGVKYYVNGALVRELAASSTASGCLSQSMSIILSMETQESEGVPSSFGSVSTSVQYFRAWTRAAVTTGTAKVQKATKTCSELGWTNSVVTGVCGESQVGFKKCFNAKKNAKANFVCEKMGGRLCTHDEVLSGAGKETGCNFDKAYVWTSTSCGDGKFYVAKGSANGNVICEDQYSAYPVRCCSQVDLASSPSPVPLVIKDTVVNTKKTCAQLGWTVDGNGVCGESDKGLAKDGTDKCWNNRQWVGATKVCEAAGARLCTMFEMVEGVSKGSGCSMDKLSVWTDTSCDLGKMAINIITDVTECIATNQKRPVRCCSDVVV
jgi:hypothetical protein